MNSRQVNEVASIVYEILEDDFAAQVDAVADAQVDAQDPSGGKKHRKAMMKATGKRRRAAQVDADADADRGDRSSGCTVSAMMDGFC